MTLFLIYMILIHTQLVNSLNFFSFTKKCGIHLMVTLLFITHRDGAAMSLTLIYPVVPPRPVPGWIFFLWSPILFTPHSIFKYPNYQTRRTTISCPGNLTNDRKIFIGAR